MTDLRQDAAKKTVTDGLATVQGAVNGEKPLAADKGADKPRPTDAAKTFLQSQLADPARHWAEQAFDDGRTVYSDGGATMTSYPDGRMTYDGAERALGQWPDGSKYVLDKESCLVTCFNAVKDSSTVTHFPRDAGVIINGGKGEVVINHPDGKIEGISPDGIADLTPQKRRAGFDGNSVGEPPRGGS